MSDEAELDGGTVRDDSSVSITNCESDDDADVIAECRTISHSGASSDRRAIGIKQRRDRNVCVVSSVKGDSRGGVLVMAVYSRCAELREHLHRSINVGVGGSGVLELSGGIYLGGWCGIDRIHPHSNRCADGSDGSGSESEQSREQCTIERR